MIFRIYFSIYHVADYIDIKGDTIDEIRSQAEKEMATRSIDTATCFSERLE